MSTITATTNPQESFVRLDMDFSDVEAQFLQVQRTDVLSGLATTVRSYQPTSGGYPVAVAGRMTLYDVEAPLDTVISYTASYPWGGVVAGTTPMLDAFGRTSSSSFGTNDTGQLYSTAGGVATDYNVAAGVGTILLSTVNASRQVSAGSSMTDMDMRVVFKVPAVATGAPLDIGAQVRKIDTSNWYMAELQFTTSSTVILRFSKNVAASFTQGIASVTLSGTYAANAQYNLRVQIVGQVLRAKVWPVTANGPNDGEPGAWALSTTVTGSVLTGSGGYGVRSIAETGNTNTTPTFSVDSIIVVSSNPTVSTSTLQLASNGLIQVKDPLRPANSVQADLGSLRRGIPDWLCRRGSSFGYLGVAAKSRAARSGVFEVPNQAEPVTISRVRGSPSTSLGLVARSFADRDAMVTLLSAGSALLIQTPAAYGEPDQYAQVLDVGEDPVFQDRRRQPRLFTIPYRVTKAPSGPPQGAQGQRWGDIGARYTTNTALAAAGLTWTQVLDGQAAI